MRVCRAKILKFAIRRAAQRIVSLPRHLEKTALTIPPIAPLLSSGNLPDGYTRLCNRLPCGSLRTASQKLPDIEPGSGLEHDARLLPPLPCRAPRRLSRRPPSL